MPCTGERRQIECDRGARWAGVWAANAWGWGWHRSGARPDALTRLEAALWTATQLSSLERWWIFPSRGPYNPAVAKVLPGSARVAVT